MRIEAASVRALALCIAGLLLQEHCGTGLAADHGRDGRKVVSSRGPETVLIAKEGEVVFVGPDGHTKAKIDVQIATTVSEQEIGLMNRPGLGEFEGMLFLRPAEGYLAFWMKNTMISLDMIFVNREMEIVTIHAHTIPCSEISYESTHPAQYVVEVNAGFTERFDIRVGDRVYWQRM